MYKEFKCILLIERYNCFLIRSHSVESRDNSTCSYVLSLLSLFQKNVSLEITCWLACHAVVPCATPRKSEVFGLGVCGKFSLLCPSKRRSLTCIFQLPIFVCLKQDPVELNLRINPSFFIIYQSHIATHKTALLQTGFKQLLR